MTSHPKKINPERPGNKAAPRRNVSKAVWRVHQASLALCLLSVATHTVPFAGLPLRGAPNYVTSSVWVLFSALYINTSARIVEGSLRTLRAVRYTTVFLAASSVAWLSLLDSTRPANTRLILGAVQMTLFAASVLSQRALYCRLADCTEESGRAVVYPVSRHKGYMVTCSVFFVLLSGFVASLHLV